MPSPGFPSRITEAREFNSTIGDDLHMHAGQFFHLVDGDPDSFYAPWFNAMGALQVAIDRNHEDAQDGLMMTEQVERMSERIHTAIADLMRIAEDLQDADTAGAF